MHAQKDETYNIDRKQQKKVHRHNFNTAQQSAMKITKNDVRETFSDETAKIRKRYECWLRPSPATTASELEAFIRNFSFCVEDSLAL